MVIHSYRDLDVWKKSIALTKSVYVITENFPAKETYGLAAHIRKTAVSVPSNIAEGRGRRRTKEFLRFIDVAYGSLCELETQLIISGELNYISNNVLHDLLNTTSEIGRMLNGLYLKLEAKLIPESPIPNAESLCF